MATMDEDIRRTCFDNFISVAVALKITIHGLQDYVTGTLNRIHQDIYNKCAIWPKCNVDCSRKFKNRFALWCGTCKSWKNELHMLVNYNKHWDNIKWDSVDSADFPLSVEEISKVFIRDFQSVRHGCLLQDLNSILSLFRNLKPVKGVVNEQIIIKVLRIRNENFGHNYQLRLHDPEKRQSIECFKELLRVTDIACTSSAKNALTHLIEIENNETVPARILQEYSLENITQFRDEYQNNLEIYHSLNIEQETFLEVVDIPQLKTQETSRHIITSSNLLIFFIISTIVAVGHVGISTFYFHNQLPEYVRNGEGCLSMRFDEHWRSDIDFDFYIEDLNNQSFIERKWLQRLLQERIKGAERGVMLTSGMGYGKSSFISNLICAQKGSALYNQRKQVLAYHMCRYNVKMSLKPEIFIRNLAGRLVKTIPQVGNVILSDERALDFLEGLKCTEDPISCAEFSVLNPLKSLPTENTYLIVVDALDECDIPGANNLVTYLYQTISFFPRNVKFLFTSRNIEQLIYKFRELELIDLQKNDTQNIMDIRSYIEQSQRLTPNQILRLTEDSSGNFLYVKLMLQYCKKIGMDRCDHLPQSLEKVYMLNFERVFGESGKLFQEFIQIFEVLCALHSPIEEERLLLVANFTTKELKQKALRLLGNELGHFIKNSFGYLSFQHKSLSDFITNSSRKHLAFYVDETNGHKLFATYMLKSLNLTAKDNLVEIANHVALTGEVEFEDMLINYDFGLNKGKISSNFTYLDMAARTVNNFDTIRLLVRLVILDSENQKSAADNDKTTERRNNISVSAFIAAANGNDKSLRAFIHFGASMEYKHYPLFEHFSAQGNAPSICKYELLCGYNYMHIAAQRGHLTVVRYLIGKNYTLLYQINSLNLTAFQLAAENGHISVLEEILSHNKTFANLHSLHHAAENGHLEAVELISQHVQDACLSCNGSIDWRRPLSDKMQDDLGKISVEWRFDIKGNGVFKSGMYDDFRLITCDTALNAATRNGHFEIVKFLLRKNLTLNCETLDGSIPLMTAIKYNRSEIFKFLYEKGANHSHRCRGLQTQSLDRSKLFASELLLLTKNVCPNNGGVAHLLGIYDNLEIIQFLIDKGHNFWESQDSDGNTPVHYAFCHNSVNFLYKFVFEKGFRLNLTITSKNGSTPFHSAAICKSLTLYRYYKGKKGNEFNLIPDIKDNSNISILQYGLSVSVDSDDLIKIDREGRDEWTQRLFQVIISSRHDIRQIDKNGKTFLHYAAQSGNYWAFVIMIANPQLFYNDVGSFLYQRDDQNRTPIEVAFDAMPKREYFEPIKIPNNCSLNAVFSKTCFTNYSILLSPHEYFIFYISQDVRFKEMFSSFNLTHLLITSITKSRLYPILCLKAYGETYFVDAVSNSTEISYLVINSDIPFLSELILNIDGSIKCDGSESPLHYIIHNDRNSRWRYSSFAFLNPLFSKYSIWYLDNCFDKDGYNILQRSVMGGNTETFLYLLNKGMNVKTLSVKNETLLEISVLKAPFMRNGSIPSYYNTGSRFHVLEYVFQTESANVLYDNKFEVNFDKASTVVLSAIKEYGTDVQLKLCDSGSKNLGLIHVAAAKGFLSYLQKVKHIFGVKILECINQYGITPLYLSKLYGQAQLVNWLTKLKVTRKSPRAEVEKVLVYNMLDNFASKSKTDWTCHLRYRTIYTVLTKRQIEKCIKSQTFLPIMYQSNFKKVIKLFLNAMFINELSHYDLKLLNDLAYCTLTEAQYAAYDMFKMIMLFGYDDKEYHYQLLCSVSKNMVTGELQPLTTNDVIKLFRAVFHDRNKYLVKLEMAHDLHFEWLNDKLQTLSGDTILHFKNFLLFSSLQSVRVQASALRVNSSSCSRLSRKIENQIASYDNEFLSCSTCMVDNMINYLSFIRNSDDLYLVAVNFAYTQQISGYSLTELAKNNVQSILELYEIKEFHHKIIKLEILINKTLLRIMFLPNQDRLPPVIKLFRQYLSLILEGLEYYTGNTIIV